MGPPGYGLEAQFCFQFDCVLPNPESVIASVSQLPFSSSFPQAFTSGLRRYLQYYRACVLSTPPTLSLLTIGFLFKKLGRQLR